MFKYDIGKTVFYKGLFGKLIEAKIIDRRRITNLKMIGSYVEPFAYYEYIIQFKNGKKKIVKSKKLF